MELVAPIAAITGLFVLTSLLGRVVRVRQPQQVPCPERAQELESVVFERRLSGTWDFGPVTRVQACSVFADPSKVTCGMACMKAAVIRL